MQSVVRKAEEVMISGLVHMHSADKGLLPTTATLRVRTGHLAHNQKRAQGEESSNVKAGPFFMTNIRPGHGRTNHTGWYDDYDCKYLLYYVYVMSCHPLGQVSLVRDL